MKKEDLSTKLEKILLDANISFNKVFSDRNRITYLIPTISEVENLTINIMDTDDRIHKNEYGINILEFQEDDEIMVTGFGIDEECGIITLRNVFEVLMNALYKTVKVVYETSTGIYEEYIDNIDTLDAKQVKSFIEKERQCSVIFLVNYYGTVKYSR